MNLMENNKTVYLFLGLALGGLLLTGYLATYVVPQALVNFSMAAPILKVSPSESYVLGSKMLAKADGVDVCKINVFVIDPSGKGIKDKTVLLKGLDGAKAVNSKTDANGMMTFTLTSIKEGQFAITAMVDGVNLQRKVACTFRNIN